MGSVRGRLTLVAALSPQAAWAEVCALQRPDWTAADGPRGALGEMGYILTSPLGLMLMAGLVLAFLVPRRWLAVVAALPALGLAWLLMISRQAEGAALAMAEGCVGSALPTAILLVALAAIVLVRGFRARPAR